MKKFVHAAGNLGVMMISLIALFAFASDPPSRPFSINNGDAEVNIITNSESMDPFANMEAARVTFFSTAVFKRNTDLAKQGEQALILSTVNCKDKTIRRTMTAKTPVGSTTSVRLFPNDEGVAQSLQTQKFRKPTSAERAEVESVCQTYWHPIVR